MAGGSWCTEGERVVSCGARFAAGLINTVPAVAVALCRQRRSRIRRQAMGRTQASWCYALTAAEELEVVALRPAELIGLPVRVRMKTLRLFHNNTPPSI